MNHILRLLLAAVFVVTLVTPTRAAAQAGDYWMEFAFFVPEGQYTALPSGGCTIYPDAFMLGMNVTHTPYQTEGKFLVGEGRIVTAEGSPVDGQAGCVFETIVTFQEFETATFTFEVMNITTAPILIDLGTVTWEELSVFGRGEDPTFYILDQQALESHAAVPYVPGSDALVATPTPDLMATIEAQQVEIESLKATIEALATPAP